MRVIRILHKISSQCPMFFLVDVTQKHTLDVLQYRETNLFLVRKSTYSMRMFFHDLLGVLQYLHRLIIMESIIAVYTPS